MTALPKIVCSTLPVPQLPPAAAPLATQEDLSEQDDDKQLAADISYCEALPSSQELKLTLDSSNYVTASEARYVLGGRGGVVFSLQ